MLECFLCMALSPLQHRSLRLDVCTCKFSRCEFAVGSTNGYDACKIQCVVLWLGLLVQSCAQAYACARVDQADISCKVCGSPHIAHIACAGGFCGALWCKQTIPCTVHTSSPVGQIACAGGLRGALCAGQRMHGAAGAAPHLAGIRDQTWKGAQERRLCRCGRALSLSVPPRCQGLVSLVTDQQSLLATRSRWHGEAVPPKALM